MEAIIGMVMLVVWCGLGFAGDALRAEKGYSGGTLAAILWGGGFYFFSSMLLPRRKA